MSPQDDVGLLIINADDWGHDQSTTGAIVACHLAGGVTSTSAMAFMRGSKAAAEQSHHVPRLGIGLHLNFTEEYSDPAAPMHVRDRQKLVIEHFRRMRVRRWLYDPRIASTVDKVISDQYQNFIDLYKCKPTHIDGHHHGHFTANVLLSRSLPAKTKIRNALSDAHRPNPITAILRRARARILRTRFPMTDYFFDVKSIWPAMSGELLSHKLALARHSSVEIMVHPAFPEEYEPLQSDTWMQAISRFRTGTYDDL